MTDSMLVSNRVPLQDLTSELQLKLERVLQFLHAHNLSALLIEHTENISWLTAGMAARRVRLPSDTGVVSLLIRADGKRFYITTNNEALRLAEEDFASLDYEPFVLLWQHASLDDAISQLADGPIASDRSRENLRLVDLTPLRSPLCATEVERYRWLGEATADVVAGALDNFTPGVSEREIAARVSYEFLRRAIEPSVLLIAVDDRIRKYKHAVVGDQTLQRFGMINLCARRWGLAISITRFVHFGQMPSDLAEYFTAAATVNALLQDATRENVSSAELFRIAQRAYEMVGFPGEEMLHHQGGAAGYTERDWVARPNGTELVQSTQAFAWNPSIRGGKVEDTVLLDEAKISLLTETPTLPIVHTEISGTDYRSAGVLIRS